jgi:hypothetical protein
MSEWKSGHRNCCGTRRGELLRYPHAENCDEDPPKWRNKSFPCANSNCDKMVFNGPSQRKRMKYCSRVCQRREAAKRFRLKHENDEELKAQKREYMRLYMRKYLKNPEKLAKHKETVRKYQQKPEVKRKRALQRKQRREDARRWRELRDTR